MKREATNIAISSSASSHNGLTLLSKKILTSAINSAQYTMVKNVKDRKKR